MIIIHINEHLGWDQIWLVQYIKPVVFKVGTRDPQASLRWQQKGESFISNNTIYK